jgi:hypothetical protein
MSSCLFDAPFLNEDDDEDYDLVAAVCAAFLTWKHSRHLPPKRKRLDWKAHIKRLHKEGQFQQMYRMSYKSFCKLARLVKFYLLVDEKQSNRRSCGAGPISVKILLHCLIRYMAGGSHHDICVAAGLAKSTVFYCLHRGIDAINKCSELALHFPTNLDKLKRTALEF